MKIHFDGVNFQSSSGPNSFATRLFKGLLIAGHDIVDDGYEADVSLVFIEPTGRPLAKKIVQRLDGIWFKPDEFLAKNVNIKALYDRADAVIWQSDFDRSMTTRWWGLRSGAVIHNGIEKPTVVTPPNLTEFKQRHNKVFVSSSNWHPQNRLRSNIELFSNLLLQHPGSALIVMGSNPDCWVPSPQISYTGSLSHSDCLSIFSIADWMIHLAWLDHCPNVVVEAVASGVPVICAESGGTKELVGGFGAVILEKQEYGFELVDYDKPPAIDVSNFVLPDKDSLGQPLNVDIGDVVNRYIDLLKSL